MTNVMETETYSGMYVYEVCKGLRDYLPTINRE